VYVVVVFFAALYVVLEDQMSGLDTRLDGLYFAVTTLSTVGYGDITATGQGARAVVIVQMLFDLIIVTSAISIVISALRGPDADPQAGN
jgi:voltage-gated potassium channel